MTGSAPQLPVVSVTGAVIERDGCVLITRRAPGQKHAGQWEFPGGKLEPGETPAACLARELREELGIEATIGALLWTGDHAYPERVIRLFFLRVEEFTGTIRLRDHDAMAWVSPAGLRAYDLLPADRPFIPVLERMVRA